jgi:signal transduction histidine kinase
MNFLRPIVQPILRATSTPSIPLLAQYMKKQLLYVLLLLVGLASLAQAQSQHTLDSLTSLLTQTIPDTLRLSVYEQLASKLVASDSATAEQYIRDGLSLSEQLLDEETQWSLKAMRGEILWRKGYYDEGREVCEQVLKEIGTNFQKVAAKCLLQIAITYDMQGQASSALSYYDRSLATYQHINNQKGIATVYINKGIFYQYLGDYNNSVIFYDKALKEYQIINNERGIASTYQSIGNIYQLKSDYAQCIEYYQKSLKILQRIGNQYGMGGLLNNIASVYEHQSNYEEAHQYYKKAVDIFEEAEDWINMAQVLNNIGNLYQFQERYEEAILPLNLGMEITTQMDSPKDIATFAYTIGASYLNQGKEDSAFHYFNQSFDIHKSLGNLQLLRDEFEKIGKWYTFHAQIPKALDFYYDALKISEVAQDTLGKANIQLAMANLHKYQEQSQEALEYYHQALSNFKKLQNLSKVAEVQMEISSLLSKDKDGGKSLEYAIQAFQAFQQLQDSCKASESMINAGQAYALLQKNDSALYYFQQATPQAISCNYYSAVTDGYIGMGKIYQQQRQTRQAFRAFEKALFYAQESNNRLNIKEAAAYVYPLYQSNGQYKKAFETLQVFQINNDSIFNQINTRKLAQREIQYAYEKEQRKQEIIQIQKDAKQQQKLERQRWVSYSFIGGFTAMILIALVVYRNYRNKQKANTLLQEQNEEITTQRDYIQFQAEELETNNEKLEQSNQQLKKLDQMKRQLTGMIVHDLKTPLGFIAQEATQESVKRQAQQMLQLILNMLDTQKMEEAEVKVTIATVGVQEILVKAQQQVLFLANQRNIKLVTNQQTKNNQGMLIDQSLTERILVNLLTNAIKFSPLNSQITIQTEYLNENNETRISIIDQGTGIPKDKISTLFNQFSQVEARKSGGIRSTGLGLAFCKLATEAQGGRIGVHSEEGQGTTFWICLALSEENIISIKKAEPIKNIAIEEYNYSSSLSVESLQDIQPYINRLKLVEVYDFSVIEEILEEITDASEEIQTWKKVMQIAIDNCNEEQYKSLLDSV